MLNISVNNKHEKVRYEYVWHVGEATGWIKGLYKSQWNGLMIQADGDELEYILDIFSGTYGYTIPYNNKKVMRWCGDIALTILSNL